jgi:hypothetical protein
MNLQAREYGASLDAYTLAIELFPGSALAYGNRAAANIKVCLLHLKLFRVQKMVHRPVPSFSPTHTQC